MRLSIMNIMVLFWSTSVEKEIVALSQWGKDDGDYDSPTSRDETPDEKKEKGQKNEKAQKNKKWEKKREGAMLLSFFHTCASN